MPAHESTPATSSDGAVDAVVGHYRHEVIATVFRVGLAAERRAATSNPDGDAVREGAGSDSVAGPESGAGMEGDAVREGVGSAQELQVLAWRRRRDPFNGRWALPSGPVAPTETMEECLARTLAAKVDLAHVAHREQLDTRSDPGRDPFERTIATAYLALVPTDHHPDLPTHADWVSVAALPPMAFDHADVVVAAALRLRNKLSYTNLGFALAPPTFTMAQLRHVYRAALGRDIDATNLQRVLQRRGQLEPTGQTVSAGPTGGRPATEYRFTARTAEITDPFAVLRPTGS